MTKHDSSTNAEAFTSVEHAVLTGGISMVLYLNFGSEYEVNSATTDNDDYLPAVDMVHKLSGRRFRVVVAEVLDA